MTQYRDNNVEYKQKLSIIILEMRLSEAKVLGDLLLLTNTRKVLQCFFCGSGEQTKRLGCKRLPAMVTFTHYIRNGNM